MQLSSTFYRELALEINDMSENSEFITELEEDKIVEEYLENPEGIAT